MIETSLSLSVFGELTFQTEEHWEEKTLDHPYSSWFPLAAD